MEVLSGNSLLPGDPRLIDHIVCELKSQGIFDQFRKECIADVDTKPAYQNLRQRVEGSVSGFLKTQTWKADLNKNQLREMLRKNIYESGFLETGVERIVDQVVNPKINAVFLPQVEDVVYQFLGLEKPDREHGFNGPLSVNPADLLPTDLDPISPDSEVMDKSINKSDKSADTDKLDDSKIDDFESPPFEPITEQSVFLPHDESSNDSRLSGISGLTSNSNISNAPMEIVNVGVIEAVNQDSQLSKVSSNSHLSIITNDDKMSEKMDISDDTQTSRASATRLPDAAHENGYFNLQNQVDIIRAQGGSDREGTDKGGADKESSDKVAVDKMAVDKMAADKVAVDKMAADKESFDKVGMDVEVVDKGVVDPIEGVNSTKAVDSVVGVDPVRVDLVKVVDPIKVDDAGTDKPKDAIKPPKAKDGDRGKDRSKRDSERRSSKSDKDRRDDKSKRSDKDRKDRDKYKSSSSSKDRSRDHKSSKDKKKDDTKRSDDKKSEDKKPDDKKSDEKSSKSDRKSSSSSSKSRDRSTSNKKDDDKKESSSRHRSSSRSDKSKSRSESKSHSHKSSRDKDRKDVKKSSKKDKDDHASVKDKKSDGRRSTDRDSNDGSSGTTSGPNKESTEKPKGLEASDNSQASGDSNPSENNEAAQDAEPQTEEAEAVVNPILTMRKPKFASNIFEARRMVKIRKKMEKMERKRKQAEEVVVERPVTPKVPDDEPPEEVSPIIPVNSVISKASWDAIEAKLNQNLINVDYDSYVDETADSPTRMDDVMRRNEDDVMRQSEDEVVQHEDEVVRHEDEVVRHEDEVVRHEDEVLQQSEEEPDCNDETEPCDDDTTRRKSEDEDCLYFNPQVSPTTERYLKQIANLQRKGPGLTPDDMAPPDQDRATRRRKPNLKYCSNDYTSEFSFEDEPDRSDDDSPKTDKKGKKRKIDSEIDSFDTDNNNKKIHAAYEVTEMDFDDNEPSPCASNASSASNEPATKPKPKRKTLSLTVQSEAFPLPLSPESDISGNSYEAKNTKNPDEKECVTRSRSSAATKCQRYSSDDLYKPRPFVSRTRRTRGASDADKPSASKRRR